MDKEVYPNDSLTNLFENRFIAVKVQMDSTTKDNLSTRAWYGDAAEISKRYTIDAFPTLLFFSPDGNLTEREIGFCSVQKLYQLSCNALDTAQRYSSLLKRFKKGYLNDIDLPELANKTRRLKDEKLAKAIAEKYIETVLLKLPSDSLFTKQNLQFLLSFTQSSSDKAFKILLDNPDHVNAAMNRSSFIQPILHYIIYMETIDPVLNKLAKLKSTENVPWDSLSAVLTKKFNLYYSDRVIADAKSNWFYYKKNWPKYSKALIEFATNFRSSMSNEDLNDIAWKIFLVGEDRKHLRSASRWMKKLLKPKKIPFWIYPTFSILMLISNINLVIRNWP